MMKVYTPFVMRSTMDRKNILLALFQATGCEQAAETEVGGRGVAVWMDWLFPDRKAQLSGEQRAKTDDEPDYEVAVYPKSRAML